MAVETTPQVASSATKPEASDSIPQEDRLQFPPFPDPPPGVTIVPFEDFAPLGIQINLDAEPDAKEIDGLGIKTIELASKHELTEAEQRKRRKIKSKRTTAIGPDGQERRLTWWEEWEEGEQYRRMSPILSVNQVERLYQASEEFKSTRSWPHTTGGLALLNLWDVWRMYIGLISSVQQPGGKRRPHGQPDPDEEDDSDDEDSRPSEQKEHPVSVVDDDAAREKDIETAKFAAAERREKNEELYKERAERRQDKKDSRMSQFFQDPETAIKIFFSAHYRDKGYAWNFRNCRDGPILVEFFLEFILRNKAFPEYGTEFNKALEACRLARVELPHTDVMGKALPGKFSDGCIALFGDLANKHMNRSFDSGSTTVTEEERDSKKRKVDGEDDTDLQEFKATAKEANLQFIDNTPIPVDHDVEMVKDAVADNLDINGVEPAETSAWGNIQAEDGPTAWDNSETPSRWDATTDTNAAPWAPVIENPATTWGGNSFGWFDDVKKGIFEIMGPTMFPLTHTTGVVEDSARRIMKITPATHSFTPSSSASKKSKRIPHPAEPVEGEFPRRLAQVVMAPYKRNGNHVNSDIVTPCILSDSRGPVVPVPPRGAAPAEPSANDTAPGAVKPHDPLQDEITVLFDEETAGKLKEGMGIRGTWVQLVRIDTANTEPEPVGMAKTGGPGWNGQPTKYWYLAHTLANLTSFHTDRYYPNQD